MELRYISGTAWHELETKHRAAYMFLLTESLKGERRALLAKRELLTRRHASGSLCFPDSATPLATVERRLAELNKPEYQ